MNKLQSYIILFGYLLSLFIVTWYSSSMMDDLHIQVRNLQEEQYDCLSKLGVLEFNVTVTMYNPIRSQTDSTPNELADGTKINPNRASEYRYVALSRDLLSRWGGPFNYGDYIIIEGTGNQDGIYQVRDTMNSKFIKRVDILETFGSSSFKYTNIRLYKYYERTFTELLIAGDV